MLSLKKRTRCDIVILRPTNSNTLRNDDVSPENLSQVKQECGRWIPQIYLRSHQS